MSFWTHARLCALSFAVCGSLLCAGCASYLSTPSGEGGVEGLVYYLPKRPIAVQVKVDDAGKIQTVSMVSADAIPDYRHRYVLTYQTTLIAENVMKIGVTSKGLLTSQAASTVTSGLDKIAESLGTIAGQITAKGFTGESHREARPRCDAGQTYTLLIFPELDYTDGTHARRPTHVLCDFDIAIGAAPSGVTTGSPTEKATGSRGAFGIFYRTEVPYLVRIQNYTAGSQATFAVAYSPNEAAVSFLPVDRTLFGKNDAKIALSDGMVTGYEQDETGELVAFLQLPAKVVDAYFKAIGGMFTSTTAVSDDRNALAVTEARRQLCAAAVAANPLGQKTGTDLETAYANIKTACSP